MKSPTRDTLEAIVQLSSTDRSWTMLMTWLKLTVADLTHRALQSADARMCGAAFELQDLVDKLESARSTLDKMKNS